jgi:hypothetical protein
MSKENVTGGVCFDRATARCGGGLRSGYPNRGLQPEGVIAIGDRGRREWAKTAQSASATLCNAFGPDHGAKRVSRKGVRVK